GPRSGRPPGGHGLRAGSPRATPGHPRRRPPARGTPAGRPAAPRAPPAARAAGPERPRPPSAEPPGPPGRSVFEEHAHGLEAGPDRIAGGPVLLPPRPHAALRDQRDEVVPGDLFGRPPSPKSSRHRVGGVKHVAPFLHQFLGEPVERPALPR